MYWLTSKGTFVTVDKNVESKCMAEVNDKKFCKFAAHVKKIGDYKLTLNATASNSTTSYEVSGSKEGNTQMTVSTDGKKVATIVVFDNVTYVEDPADSAWIKYASSAANKPEVFDLKKEIGKDDFKGDKGQKLVYKSLGTETCDTNLTCYKYQITDTQNTSTQTYLWFDNLQFLLRKLTANDNTSSSEMTMSYQGVSIVQPAPVKQTVN